MRWSALVLLILTSFAAWAALAQPSTNTEHLPDLRPNSDWNEIAVQIPQAMQARAWSDPSAGCHLAVFRLPISSSVNQDKVLLALSKTLSGGQIHIKPTEGSFLSITSPQVSGIASLNVSHTQEQVNESSQAKTGFAELQTCYWSDREPQHCERMCESIMKTMPEEETEQ
jgi:hypothetical protein